MPRKAQRTPTPIEVTIPFDPYRRLPEDLIIEDIDDILYRIGLCFDSVREQPKRLAIDHPFLGFFFVTFYIGVRLTTYLLPDGHDLVFRALASQGHFIGDRKHMDLYFIMLSVNTLVPHIIYYYNHRHGVKPTFLRVFQMMAGQRTPASVGLTDEEDVTKLCKLSANQYQQIKMNIKYVNTVMDMVFIPIFFLLDGRGLEVLYFGLPNAILFTLWAHYFWRFLMFQFLFFFILCTYLKMKIKELDKKLVVMNKHRLYNGLEQYLDSFNKLISEIGEYNGTFWSKILISYWFIWSNVIILLGFVAVFQPMPILLKGILCYCCTAFTVAFLFLIFTASSVNYAVTAAYKKLNTFIIGYFKHNKDPLVIEARNLIKVNALIERVAKRKVGFSCWKLFTINYFRSYEILSIIACMILKLVQNLLLKCTSDNCL